MMKIYLLIQNLSKDEILNLSYDVNNFYKFVELQESQIPTQHSFYHKIIYPTQEISLNVILTNGKVSVISGLEFAIEYNNKKLTKQISKCKAGKVNTVEELGKVRIKIDNSKTYINWNCNQIYPPGSLYKIYWYTSPK